MRVLFLTNMSPTKNEPAQGLFVKNQFNAVKSLGIDAIYYAMPSAIKKFGFSPLRYIAFFFHFIFQFIFSRKRVDIIHVHFFFPNILLAIAYRYLRNNKTKIIVTFHGSDIYKYQTPSIIYRFCLKFIDDAIFVSANLKARLAELTCNSAILPVGISDVFSPQACSDKKFDFIFVGRLDENKGVSRLLELISEIPKTTKLLIVGSGELKEKILAIDKVNLNVTYIDHLTPQELVPYYRQSKWLINLSFNESFGLVMTEAMACGVPVVATETDGAMMQITDEQTGFLISQENFSIKDVFKSTSDLSDFNYQKMSKAASISASKYRLDEIAAQLVKIYRK